MEFWKDIWSKPTWHNENVDWLHNLKEETKIERQNDFVITREKVEDFVNKTPNWKSPGPDLVQGFWLKRFTNLQERITLQYPAVIAQLHVSLCAGIAERNIRR